MKSSYQRWNLDVFLSNISTMWLSRLKAAKSEQGVQKQQQKSQLSKIRCWFWVVYKNMSSYYFLPPADTWSEQHNSHSLSLVSKNKDRHTHTNSMKTVHRQVIVFLRKATWWVEHTRWYTACVQKKSHPNNFQSKMWTNSVHKLFALSASQLCVLANNTFKSQYLRMYPADIWTRPTLQTGFNSLVDAEWKFKRKGKVSYK